LIPVLATTSASPFNTITRQRISINDGWLFYFILQTFRIDPLEAFLSFFLDSQISMLKKHPPNF